MTRSTSTEARPDEHQQTVCPIGLNVMLEGTQVVELEIRADHAVATEYGQPMSYYRYLAENQDEDRFYIAPDSGTGSAPAYEYRVTVTASGECWRSGWRSEHGAGPLIVSVPLRHDPGAEPIELGHR